MISDSSVGRSLKVLAERLFSQIKAFGQFGLDRDALKDRFETQFGGRYRATAQLLSFLEEAANLRFEPGEVPYCYHTGNWPADAGLAGYAGANASIRPSHVLKSLVMMWYNQWETDPRHQQGVSRLVRSALWICHHEGLRKAFQYLLDLYRHGFILQPEVLRNALDILLGFRCDVESDLDLVALFFGGQVPEGAATWIATDLADLWRIRRAQAGPAGPLLRFLIEACVKDAEKARKAGCCDEWGLRAWAVADLIPITQGLVRNFWTEIPVMWQAILDQLEEVQADGFAFKILMRGRTNDCGPQRFFDWQEGFATILRCHSPHDWKDRFLRQRLLIPYDLGGVLLENWDAELPPRWRRLSPTLSAPFHIVVSGTNYLFERSEPFPPDRLAKVTEVKHFLTVGGIRDEREQLQAVQLRHSFDDASVKRDDLKRVCSWAHDQLAVAEVKSAILQSIELRESRRHEIAVELLQALSDRYPGHSFVHFELGIAFDEAGNPESALRHLETAIVLTPDGGPGSMSWRSLGVVLRKLGRAEESLLATLMAQEVAKKSG